MNNPEQSEVVFIPLTRMEYPQRHGISCYDCAAACCSEGTVLALTNDEAFELALAGTDLGVYEGDRKLPRHDKKRGAQFYKFLSPCATLVQLEQDGPGSCKVFGSPERPRTCGEFRVASYECEKAVDIQHSQRPLVGETGVA